VYMYTLTKCHVSCLAFFRFSGGDRAGMFGRAMGEESDLDGGTQCKQGAAADETKAAGETGN